MLKSEAEKIFRRAMEETNAQFSDEQVQCIVQAMLKIGGRMVEEAMASNRSTGGNRRPGYFAD